MTNPILLPLQTQGGFTPNPHALTRYIYTCDDCERDYSVPGQYKAGKWKACYEEDTHCPECGKKGSL